ncbi:MAG: phosphoenolpyruvate--protein phosphotransferase [Rhodothermales bacterium]|nr:phosphoenolpyruvate--protein phosphotransferase [Rhodothermales bacterium]MBO6781443.1 phosphoenolpyruvate--protein phosphotransferase [Rhodothermales bacterium]
MTASPNIPDPGPDRAETIVSGIPASPGITIGPAYVYRRESFSEDRRELESDDVQEELDRFERAVEKSERDLGKIIAITREKVGEESAAIFDAQRLILRDSEVYGVVKSAISRDRVNAGYAVEKVLDRHRKVLEASDSEYMRERAQDLVDVKDRLVRHLRKGRALSRIDPNHIVVAENLSAADMVLFSRRGVLGCAMDFGGPTSHVAIMARALSVPAVVGLHGVSKHLETGDVVVLDGIQGTLILNPTDETLDRYKTRAERFQRLKAEEKDLVPLESETLDGHHIRLEANLELKDEIPLVAEYGAEGVGLFRTEILFLMQGRLVIEEDQQYEIYKEVVDQVSPNPTTFRVIDLGGDKLLPMGHREHNPFLGWRGIRVLLDKPEILLPQLRAILRASAHGPVRIMVPMITEVAEIREFRQLLEKAQTQLSEQGVPYDSDVKVGIMIEVPSAALLADRFAPYADFFSIGTNDLTQYTLAVDRGNDLVAGLYQDLHPAVLMLIRRTVEAARGHGIPVSVCGEMATNLRAVPVLIGLGVETLSASPVYLPSIKRVVRAMKRSEGRLLASEALQSKNAAEVGGRLDQWLDEHACGVGFFLEGTQADA